MHDGIKYDVAVTAHGSIVDGVKITRTHYVGDIAKFSFSHIPYEPATYKQALEAVGFENIEWAPLVVEPGGEQEFPEGYWNEYLNDFSIRGLRATKKK